MNELISFHSSYNHIIMERIDMLKFKSNFFKTKYYYYYSHSIDIDLYVRVLFILGEPL